MSRRPLRVRARRVARCVGPLGRTTLGTLACALALGHGAQADWSKPVTITPSAHLVQTLSLALGDWGDIEAVGTPQSRIDGVAAYSSHDRGPFEVQRLNPSPGDSPIVALDGAGTAVVLSYRIDADLAIRAYEKPPGGRYGKARLLDPRPAYPYDLVTSPSGDVFGLWRGTNRKGTGGGPLRIAVHPPGGDFGPVQDVSEPGQEVDFVGLVFDRAGNALAAWTVQGRLEYSIRPRGGSFGPRRVLSTSLRPVYSAEFDVASNGSGRAAIVWRDHDGAGHRQVRAAFGTVAGGFGPSKAIGGRSSRGPFVRVGRDGEAVAAWRGGQQTTAEPLNVSAAIARPRRGFGAVHVLQRGAYVDQMRVRSDGHGTLRVLWRAGRRIVSARHTAGASGFDKQTVTRGRAYYFYTGATSDGRTIVAWRVFAKDGAKKVKARVARSGHSFGKARTLARLAGGFGGGPFVSTGRNGSAFVWWGVYTEGSGPNSWKGSHLGP